MPTRFTFRRNQSSTVMQCIEVGADDVGSVRANAVLGTRISAGAEERVATALPDPSAYFASGRLKECLPSARHEFHIWRTASIIYSMFEGFAKSTADIGGIDISYVIGGTGPPLLLLHGFPQCKAMWARVAPLLADRFTVVCADLRGYGDSGKPRCTSDCSNYAFRAMADDQVGLMNNLGFSRFHIVGHDRGARTAHRMALDHAHCVETLTVMDIAPTYSMFMRTDHLIAQSYWHWYFLAQPEPFPETLIGHDPDYFYERSLLGWGAARAEDFDADMMAEYRRAWRNPDMIHGSCSDYRAAGAVDLKHDTEDLGRRVRCRALMLYGAKGVMARLFDLPAEWRTRLADMTVASLPGGHFFVDQFPRETAHILAEFLSHAEVG